jgi:hypothetical protein
VTTRTRAAERNRPALIGKGAAVAVIDTALTAGAQRASFSRDEALTILEDVRQSLEATELAATVTSIVDDAVLSYEGDTWLGRWQLFDPLLDIRRMLSP